MDRRNLLKSLPALFAVPFTLTNIKTGKVTNGTKIQLEAGKKYLIVLDRSQCELGNIDGILDGFRHMNIEGQVVLAEDVDNFCRIYELNDA